MRYTYGNLEESLEKIDPERFDIYRNKAKMSLPSILDQMFIIGFQISLDQDKLHPKLNRDDINILLRAYNDLRGTGHGYFDFDEV